MNYSIRTFTFNQAEDPPENEGTKEVWLKVGRVIAVLDYNIVRHNPEKAYVKVLVETP